MIGRANFLAAPGDAQWTLSAGLSSIDFMVDCLKWCKLGQLYASPGGEDWMFSHGQVPFAQPLEADIVRVFFTTKDRQHRSHIAVAMLDLRRMKLEQLQNKPVLEPGRRGTFDDDGVMMSCLIASDEGTRAYYQGWQRGGTIPYKTAIGLALISDEGGHVTFRRRFEGPVFDRGPIEPISLGLPFVRRESN